MEQRIFTLKKPEGRHRIIYIIVRQKPDNGYKPCPGAELVQWLQFSSDGKQA